MMRVAPDYSEEANGFLQIRFIKQVLRQAGGPFTSSSRPIRKASRCHLIRIFTTFLNLYCKHPTLDNQATQLPDGN
ncbi:hypothetical protein IV01_20385 [Pseudomonas syringae]|uniref:Uncharacterized protein n=1 Tax=Pseudomonas syringae TaxID=317 RepID=A0A085VD14_PSESX|nr:hypothetical protein IV01_20385 [Pseudomonas syringae]